MVVFSRKLAAKMPLPPGYPKLGPQKLIMHPKTFNIQHRDSAAWGPAFIMDEFSEPQLWSSQVEVLDRSGMETEWEEADRESIPDMHDLFIEALVDVGLIQAVFASPHNPGAQTWLIWAKSWLEVSKIIQATPLRQVGLLLDGINISVLKKKTLPPRLDKVLRPPAHNRIRDWFVQGATLDEMKKVNEETYLTDSEHVILMYGLWGWAKGGKVIFPGMTSQESADQIRLNLMEYARSHREVSAAEAALLKARRDLGIARGRLIEFGFDVDKVLEKWNREGRPEWSTLGAEWWMDEAIMRPTSGRPDDEDEE